MAPSNDKFPYVSILTRIRRNHALEHATIHVLSERFPKVATAGRSDSRGFIIYANLPRENIEECVHVALERLRAGEKHLAVHPNCGTNLLTKGIMSGTAAFFSMQGSDDRQSKLERLPLAIMGAIAGIIIAQPLGMHVQKHLTTDPEPGTLKILSVEPLRTGKAKMYRVRTRG